MVFVILVYDTTNDSFMTRIKVVQKHIVTLFPSVR